MRTGEGRRARRMLGCVLSAAVLLGGCQSQWRQAYRFPFSWPGSQPLGEEAPTVSVEPLQVVVDQPVHLPDAEAGVPTAAVLSVLLIKHLQVAGVNAILEKPDEATAPYTLSCIVPQLGYGVKDGYPKGRLYRAELVCALKDGQTQGILWKRRLTQDYEQTVLLDLLTNLPEEPHQHDRVLYRECIVPLWDTMASSVRTAVVSRTQLSRQPAPSPVPASAQP